MRKMQNVAYIVYVDKYTIIRGVRVNGLRPDKVMVYVLSSELGSKRFNRFLRDAEAALASSSTSSDVIVQVVHEADTGRMIERVEYIKEYTELHYQRLLVHEKNKVERLEKILALDFWDYIKFRFWSKESSHTL